MVLTWVGTVIGAGALAVVIITPLDLRSQALFAGGAFALCLLLNRRAGQSVTLTMALISMAVSARYLCWRIGTTLFASQWSVDVALGGVLLAAEVYAFVMLLLGYLQSLATLERKPVPLPRDLHDWPTVDFFIPTYSEPLEVVRTTVLAAKSIDWPADRLRIWLLDDGHRDTFRAFAAMADVGYIARPDNRHAKAGNLNYALTKTTGELVAIFDCDHVPTRSFLQTTVGFFLAETKLAIVQTPHHFYSPDPFERNLGTFRSTPNEGELFYGLLQPANDVWNAAFFCGSCAIIRRRALEQVGGIAVETVTEDAHTALRMLRHGWSTAYLGVVQAAGLATETLNAHVRQRIRWARGMVQIFRIDNPLLGRGLTLAQRLCFAASMLHFLGGIPRLIFLAAPLAYLLFDRHIFGALPLMALAYGLPHLAHLSLTTSRIQGGVRHSFWSEVYETCLAYYIAIPTTVALLSPKLGTFNVTAKGSLVEEDGFDARIARPYVVMLALNLAGVGAGVLKLWHGTPESDVVCMNLVWTAHNILILAATLAVAWERRQVRQSPRVSLKLPAMIRLPHGETVRSTTIDLSARGGAFSVSHAHLFAPNERVWVSLFEAGDELPLPAEVIAQDGATLRVTFTALSLEEEAALTRAIFSRANAWTAWHHGRASDRPLASLATIAGCATRGCVRVAASLLPRPTPVSKPAMASGAP
jgi:cellulose synthase (UDP-forming)